MQQKTSTGDILQLSMSDPSACLWRVLDVVECVVDVTLRGHRGAPCTAWRHWEGDLQDGV